MERLRFTYSFDINSQLVYEDEAFSQMVLKHRFNLSHGKRVTQWVFEYSHYTLPAKMPVFWLYTHYNPCIEPIDILVEHCSCKFTLKRANQPDLECFGERSGRDKDYPTFSIPSEHAIRKFFEIYVDNPKELSVTMEIELQLPKNFFVLNISTDLELAPVGWEKDPKYKLLTVKDKHDFHIVCKDGVFYMKKRDFNHSRLSEEELKNKVELKLDASLDTVKALATFMITCKFPAPKKWNPLTVSELMAHAVIFCYEPSFLESLDVYACCELAKGTPSLSELISWWKAAKDGSCSRLQKQAEMMLDKEYYAEIMNLYKSQVKFVEDGKKKIQMPVSEAHPTVEIEKELFDRITSFHNMNQRVIVTEVSEKN